MESRIAVSLLLLGVCTWEGSAQVACYTELGCSSGSLGSFPSALDCCIRDDGLSHESGSEPCLACLSYGWLDDFPLKVSKGEVLTLGVGYLKGSPAGLVRFEVQFNDTEVAVSRSEFNLELEETVEVTVLDDGLPVMVDKYIEITLVRVAGGRSIDVIFDDAILHIPADEVEVRFSSPSYSASESERLVSVCVDASFKTAVDITVNFTVISETAQESYDFLPPSEPLFEKTTDFTECLDIVLESGDGYEYTETFSVLLTATSDYKINASQNTTQITILDSDTARIVVSPESETVIEEDEDEKTLCLKLTNSAVDILVAHPRVPIQDDIDNVDGVEPEFWLPANGSSVCFKYRIIDDDEFEGEEVIKLTWTTEEPRVTSDTFTLTIKEDDTPGIQVVGENKKCGAIELLYRGQWKGVCDDYWTDVDAGVACKALGFLSFGASKTIRGRGNGQYWLDDVRCNGDESTLIECAHRGIGKHNCRRREMAGVNCLDSTDVDIDLNLPVRILEELEGSGGTIEPSGYIELRVRGEWRSVCDNFWTLEDAKVACKQLGYSTDGAVPILGGNFEDGEVQYWLDSVRCDGDEDYLFECAHKGMGVHNCGPGKRAGVKCQL